MISAAYYDSALQRFLRIDLEKLRPEIKSKNAKNSNSVEEERNKENLKC
jgi:hypothetical protein